MNYHSVSRLQTYTKCPQKFYQRYVAKLKFEEQTDSLILGDVVHKALEEYYRKTVAHPLEALKAHWQAVFEGSDALLEDFDRLSEDYSYLVWRASAECTDASLWIRNKDGKVPSPGGLERNAKYQSEEQKLGISNRREMMAIRARNAFGYPDTIDLFKVYADSFQILNGWQDIQGISDIHHVEFGISDRGRGKDRVAEIVNQLTFPKSTEDHFTGYIDLVCSIDGALTLIDHKTSVAEPSALSVMYWDQLLLYAWAYNEITGNMPELIGINHLRSGKCVLAPIDWHVVYDCLERFIATAQASLSGVYPKRSPTEYSSPCLGGAKDPLTASTCCPLLELCHPSFYERLEAFRAMT